MNIFKERDELIGLKKKQSAVENLYLWTEHESFFYYGVQLIFF